MVQVKSVECAGNRNGIIKRRGFGPNPGIQRNNFGHHSNFPALRVKCIEQNAKQPRPRIRAFAQLMKAAPRQQETFLDEILRAGGVEREPAGYAEQAPRMAHDDALEFVLSRRHWKQHRLKSVPR